MPIHVDIDEGNRRILARVEGEFGFGEIVQAITEAVRDPRFRPGFAVLSDHSEVTRPFTPAQAKHMVAYLDDLKPYVAGCRWAVVTRNEASYGMLRMVSALAERIPMQVRVFPNLADAEAWLCSPAPEGAAQRSGGEPSGGA